MRLSKTPNPFIGFLYLLLLGGSVAALVFLDQLAWFFVLLLLVLLLLLLWWLFFGKIRTPGYPPEEFYVQDEVIVRGPRTEVEDAVKAVSSIVTLTEIDRIDFGLLPKELRDCLKGCSHLDYDTLIVALYHVEGTKNAVAIAIGELNRVVGPGSDIRPEPNWLAGRPYDPTGSGADPWDPTGSGADPWDPTGSGADPWDPTGSGEKKKLKPANPDLFMKQWAFEQIGLIGLENNCKGRKVRIGIFDTWPYKKGENYSLDWLKDSNSSKPTVYHDYRKERPSKKDYDLSSHGLFTFGMAHAVAPEAEFHVYQVLNENNKGPIFSLMRAIFDFILDYTKSNSSSEDQAVRAVINMSLGIRVPPIQAKINLPAEGQAFRDLLLVADCAEIVVVAASGNNSAKGLLPEGANVPANWPEVLGVASSNKSREMACFSNKGNIGAPGGDGVKSKYNPDGCIGATSRCKQAEDCKYAVIGPVRKEDDNTGFAFWNGTSFSAPMVSGLAARLIQKGQWTISAEQVRQCIMDGATDQDPEQYMGAGIINIPETMAKCGDDNPCSDEPYRKEDDKKGQEQPAA